MAYTVSNFTDISHVDAKSKILTNGKLTRANINISDLSAGWNLISFPGDGKISSTTDTTIDLVYHFNRGEEQTEDNKYLLVSKTDGSYSVTLGKGYWVKLTLSDSVTSGTLNFF